MKEYSYIIGEDGKIDLDALMNQTFLKASFAEKRSFIWVTHPDFNFLGWKTPEGNDISVYNNDLNLFFISSRPIFFDDSMDKDVILFREYKP